MKLLGRALLIACCAVISGSASAQKKKDYAALVDPFIGTSGKGHTYPSAVLPYAMVQTGPVTYLKDWEGFSRYRYNDSLIYGFAYTHLSGIWEPDLNDIVFMPTTGAIKLNSSEYASPFTKKNESASPGYYKTKLDKYNIGVELTTTDRAGMHLYSYPSTTQANLIIDLSYRNRNFSAIEVLNDHEIRGYAGNRQTLYFHVKFSKPFKTHGITVDNESQPNEKKAQGNGVKLYLQFNDPGEVVSKVGVSAVSYEGALKNLDAEITDFDFKSTAKAAKAAWNKELSKIDVEGGAPGIPVEPSTDNLIDARPKKKTILPDYAKIKAVTFYTALYHSMLSPNINSDVDGKYIGMGEYDATEPSVFTAQGFTNYSFVRPLFGTDHPLLTLIDRKRTTDIINSFLAAYDYRDSLKIGRALRVYFENGQEMIPIIADAYAKGMRDFNAEKAIAAMKFSQQWAGYQFNDYYKRQGFIDSAATFSVSNTLKFSYDDWCIAQVARILNKQVDYNEHIKRAQYWKNLYDKQTGLIQPRTKRGFANYNMDLPSRQYYNFNAWQYLFSAQQDINSLIDASGGKDSFATKLDEFFKSESKTSKPGVIGRYDHSSITAHHSPYLFNFTDDANKTQFYLNKIVNDLYTDKPDGLPGDDDKGQLSSWYVMTCLGIYNIAPGQQQFQIGLPQFEKMTINLENGKKFNIINSGATISRRNIYLQGMNLNKKAYSKLYIDYEAIANGGEFEVFTGTLPNRLTMQEMEKPASRITDNLITPNPVITQLQTFAPPSLIEIKSNDIEPNKLYYTTDGSTPTTASKLYDKPIPQTPKMVVKAIAVKNGKASFVTEARFE